MKKIHIKVICLCLCLSSMLFVCISNTSTKKMDTINIVLDDFKEILKVHDLRIENYENALASTLKYIKSPTEENLSLAKKACIYSIRQILEIEEVHSILDDKIKNEMIALNIDIFDYSVPFNMQSYYKDNNIQTIMNILYFLNNAPIMNEQLQYMVEMNIRIEAAERKIDYLGLNGLFFKVDDKDIDDFKSNFLPSLKSFSRDNLSWEKNSTVIEAKANSLFLDIEKEIIDYSNFVGNQYVDILILNQECENVLIENGFTNDEAKEMISKINNLSQQSLNEQQQLIGNVKLN